MRGKIIIAGLALILIFSGCTAETGSPVKEVELENVRPEDSEEIAIVTADDAAGGSGQDQEENTGQDESADQTGTEATAETTGSEGSDSSATGSSGSDGSDSAQADAADSGSGQTEAAAADDSAPGNSEGHSQSQNSGSTGQSDSNNSGKESGGDSAEAGDSGNSGSDASDDGGNSGQNDEAEGNGSNGNGNSGRNDEAEDNGSGGSDESDEESGGSGSESGSSNNPGSSFEEGTYYTIEELFGYSSEFLAVAIDEVDYEGDSGNSVNLSFYDLLISVNNGRSGTYKIELDFEADGDIDKNQTFHIKLTDEFGGSLGFINLKIRKDQTVTAEGKIDLDSSYESVVVSLDLAGNSSRRQSELDGIYNKILISGVRITARPEDLD